MKPITPVTMPVSCLVDDQVAPLEWPWFKGFNIVAIGTPKDGSCFFHAILGALSTGYRNRKIGGVPVKREQLVRNARIDFSQRLKEEYTKLSRGTLSQTAETLPEVSLKSLTRQLVHGKTISYVFFELVSNAFSIDIYVLNKATQDVYRLGDDDIYRKDRQAIILLYVPLSTDDKSLDHYEVVGRRSSDGTIYTRFEPSNEFIQRIRQRELSI